MSQPILRVDHLLTNFEFHIASQSAVQAAAHFAEHAKLTAIGFPYDIFHPILSPPPSAP
jgi:hypothetical protein